MMQKRLFYLAIAAIAVTALTGCEWFIEEVLFGAGGYIVDARGSSTDMSGFTVTLTSVNGSKSKSATTSSSGYYSLGDLESGTYVVTATKEGWFVPPEKVSVGGLAESIPDVPAYQLSEDDLWGLSFIAVWDNTEGGSEEDDVDVDIHMTFSTSWTSVSGAASYSTPYDVYPSSGRDQVYFNASKYPAGSSTPAVRLDNDTSLESGPYNDTSNPQLPETITMLFATTTSGQEDTSGTAMSMASSSSGDSNGLRAAFSDDVALISASERPGGWYWIGQAEVYLNAFTYDRSSPATLANDDSGGAAARLYVIQTVPAEDSYTDGYKRQSNITLDYVYLGSYAVPEYTNISSASMVRVNMLLDDKNYEWYQIVPDVRVVPQGPTVDDGTASDITFLSVPDQDGLTGVRGRKRGAAE